MRFRRLPQSLLARGGGSAAVVRGVRPGPVVDGRRRHPHVAAGRERREPAPGLRPLAGAPGRADLRRRRAHDLRHPGRRPVGDHLRLLGDRRRRRHRVDPVPGQRGCGYTVTRTGDAGEAGARATRRSFARAEPIRPRHGQEAFEGALQPRHALVCRLVNSQHNSAVTQAGPVHRDLRR